MRQFQVTAVSVTIHTGVIELNIHQAQSRKHLLKLVNGNVYDVLAPVQFKCGEMFGYAGDINKALMAEITAITKEPAEITEENVHVLSRKKK